MKLEVLISCMHQKDVSIIQKTNIQSDVLVINQCDEDKIEEFEFLNQKGEICHARMIYTTERGLSKSRNMAIRNAKGDICLLCDDDERLFDDYPDRILNSYLKYKNKDMIAFAVIRPTKKDPDKPMKIGYLRALKITSFQITFKLDSILKSKTSFDEMLGSGTGNGGGEENEFLWKCLRKGMKMYYLPIEIGNRFPIDSKWFDGFTNRFFYNRGFSIRRTMGIFLSILYAVEYALAKYPRYKRENTFYHAVLYQFREIFQVDRG